MARHGNDWVKLLKWTEYQIDTENTVLLCSFLLPSSYWVDGHMSHFARESSDYTFCSSIVIINTPFTGIQGRCIMISLK